MITYFGLKFCLGIVSKDLIKDEMIEILENGAVYDLPVDHSAVEKDDIFNIHEYFIKK